MPALQNPILELTESEMLLQPIQVVLNPNEITPLAAEVSFQSFDSTTVEIEVDGSVPLSFKHDQASSDHKIPIIGLYPDHTNTIFIKISKP